MNTMLLSAALVALLFATLSWIAIWSRWADRGRFAALALFILGLPVILFAGIESLSWARPLWAMYDLRGVVNVLGVKMIRGEAIYLYVDTGMGQPRSIALPWSAEKSKEIQGLLDNPKNKGKLLMDFEWSWDRHDAPEFAAPVQPQEMPKSPPPPSQHLEL